MHAMALGEFPQVSPCHPFCCYKSLAHLWLIEIPQKEPAYLWPLRMQQSTGSEAAQPKRCAMPAGSTLRGSEQLGAGWPFGAGAGGLWLWLGPLSWRARRQTALCSAGLSSWLDFPCPWVSRRRMRPTRCGWAPGKRVLTRTQLVLQCHPAQGCRGRRMHRLSTGQGMR